MIDKAGDGEGLKIVLECPADVEGCKGELGAGLGDAMEWMERLVAGLWGGGHRAGPGVSKAEEVEEGWREEASEGAGEGDGLGW